MQPKKGRSLVWRAALILMILSLITSCAVFGGISLHSGRSRIDKSPPKLTVDELPDSTSQASIVISGTVSDDSGIEGVTLTVNGVEVPVNPDGTWRIAAMLEDEENEFVIVVTDKAGNMTSETVKIFSDTTPPALNTDEWEFIIDGDTVTIIGKVEDNGGGKITITVNGEEVPVNPDGTFEVEVPLEEGNNEIIIEATDGAGNTTAERVEVEYKPSDTTAPTLTVNELPDSTDSESIVISGTVSDDSGIEGVTLTVNGVEVPVNADGSWDALVSLKDGVNEFEIVATDKAGNTATEKVEVERKVVDTTAPLLTVNKLPNSTTSSSVMVSGTVSDDSGIEGVTLTVKGAEVPVNANGTWSILMPLKYGDNKFEIVATDEAGNTASETVSVFRKEPEPVFEELVAEFKLFDEIYESDGVTVENDVEGNRIAPGTGGTFTIKFKNPVYIGSSTYSLELTETNEAGIFMQYSVDGRSWNDDIEDINRILTNQPLKPSEEKILTVYWRWAYEAGHEGQTDNADTSLGIDAANGAAPVVIISVTLTVTQAP